MSGWSLRCGRSPEHGSSVANYQAECGSKSYSYRVGLTVIGKERRACSTCSMMAWAMFAELKLRHRPQQCLPREAVPRSCLPCYREAYHGACSRVGTTALTPREDWKSGVAAFHTSRIFFSSYNAENPKFLLLLMNSCGVRKTHSAKDPKLS